MALRVGPDPGPSSHPAFIQRAYARLNRQFHPASEGEDAHPVPSGIKAWGLERFFFSPPGTSTPPSPPALFIPRHVGDRFLRNYFKIVHPQIPILSYYEVVGLWAGLWEAHTVPAHPWSKEIVFTVLAIGARVSPSLGHDGLQLAEGWAEYFSQAVEIPITAMREPSLPLVHLLLLKVPQHSCPTTHTALFSSLGLAN